MAKNLEVFLIASLIICFNRILADADEPDAEDTAVDDTNSDDTQTVPATEEPELTLTEIEDLLRKAFKTWMLSLVSEAAGMIGYGEISSRCMWSAFGLGIDAVNLDDWSFRILDATGKITDGILEGTSIALGDYDECQNAVVGGREPTWEDDTGQYCLLEVRPPPGIIDAVREYQTSENRSFTELGRTKTFFSFLRNVQTDPEDIMFLLGICTPPKCTAEDIQSVLDTATEDIRLSIQVRRCESKRFPSLEFHHIIILIILCMTTAIILVGTMYDACLRLCPDDKCERIKLGRISRFAMSFSVFSNTSKLVDTTSDGNALDPVRGLKVISVIMLIYVHTYALPHPLHVKRYKSSFNFLRFTDDFAFASIANSSVGVDTVFFIIGFLSVYYYWMQDEQRSIIKYILKFFFIQYLRLILAQVLTMCLFSLLPLIGSGPLWPEFVEKKIETCKEMWWINILCIQNFWKPENSCLFHTWILAASMQIFIFTAVVIWIFSRKPLAAVLLNVAIILASIMIVGVLTTVKDLPATFSMYFYDNYRQLMEVWKYIYVQGYAHMGSYAIGMLVAYWAAKYPSVRFTKPGVLLCWCAAVITCLSIIYGLYDYRDSKLMARSLAVFYAAVHRTAWAASIGWMIYACTTGHGGFVNTILSWSLYVPLERLSYMAYMVHVPLMYYHGGIQRERIFMGQFTQVMNFLSYTVISFIISYFTFILFQAPYNALECFLFTRSSRSVWRYETGDQALERRISVQENGAVDLQQTTPVVLFNKSTENIITETW